MVRHFIKTIFRSFWRDKIFSFVNIFGLAFGLSCCLLMMVFIKNELSYDSFNTNAPLIYRVAFSNYLNTGNYATTPLPVGPALAQQFPEIKAAARINFQNAYLVKYQDRKYFENLSFADDGFFKIFSFPFVKGNPATALSSPNSIVISEDIAKKYFGSENPLNKILNIGSSGKFNSVVTGVFKKLPQNSQLQFDCVVSFSTMDKAGVTTNLWQQMPSNYAYILLNKAGDAAALQKKFPAFVKANLGAALNNLPYNMFLQPLTSIHLGSHLQSELPGEGNMSYIYLFGAIALIILLIACINFINFQTAGAIKRTKEIGLRKVIGALRLQLVKQFLGEALVTYLLAAIASVLLAQLLLPVFNYISGNAFNFSQVLNVQVIAAIIIVGLLAGAVAGFFPAWSISGLSSISALKGNVHNSQWKTIVKKSLVTVQFVASLTLIIASAVVFNQMQYIRSMAMAKAGSPVIVFSVNNKLVQSFDGLKKQLLANSHIVNVSGTTNAPGFAGDSWPLRVTENSEAIQTENFVADDDFFKTLDIPLVAGRPLNSHNGTDIKSGFVINEAAVKALGFKTAHDAVGKAIVWGGDDKKRGNVVGVVNDFHYRSLHEKVAPALVQFAPYDWMTYNYIMIKMQPGNFDNTLDYIRKTVASFDVNWPVDYKFFDENFALLHKKDEQQGQIFTAFACIAIFISCLGLLGLTIYSTRQRMKEIGIRKVLGAKVATILLLLSKDFLQLVGIAVAIASPLAWLFMSKWLQGFSYHVNLSGWIFVASGLAMAVIALITISFLAIRAALSNPVNTLRTE